MFSCGLEFLVLKSRPVWDVHFVGHLHNVLHIVVWINLQIINNIIIITPVTQIKLKNAGHKIIKIYTSIILLNVGDGNKTISSQISTILLVLHQTTIVSMVG